MLKPISNYYYFTKIYIRLIPGEVNVRRCDKA
jgi:hypothetical protein